MKILHLQSRSNIHRLKMLVKDIASNRYRVKSIFTRIADDMGDKDDALPILQALVREELLSKEQFEKLAKLEEIELPALAVVIKDTKVGQGLKFLPTAICNLRKTLPSLLTELTETTGNSMIRKKLTAVLEELQRRKGISNKRYTEIMQQFD